MNKIENLDLLVKEQFEELLSDLKSDEKQFIHHKSIENFILYLVDNPHINPKKNNTLQELGEIRMKKSLLEFFKEVKKN